MSEHDESVDEEITEEQRRELLFARAKLMGIKHSNNIGNDKLAALITAKQEGESVEEDEEEFEQEASAEEDQEVNGFTNEVPAVTAKKSLRQQLLEENMKLVRLRITNLNPAKKDLHGEIFTLANGVVGTIRKFIPYGEVTQDGFHVPYCIYKRLKNRKFLHIRSITDPKTKQIRVTSSYANEFALEVLPQLKPQELRKLGQAQLAAGSLEVEASLG